MEDSEVLLGSEQVAHPVRLEADQHHVRRQLAQPGQVQAGLGSLLKAVALGHCTQVIQNTKVVT